MNDRASDNWSPLFAIADMAGREWGERARAAALAISRGAESEEQDIRFELLKDIRSIFDEEGGESCRSLSTASLIEKLSKREESPWATFNRGQPINPRALARMLRPFGIASSNLKMGHDPSGARDVVAKGYKREAFTDAWSRYLPMSAAREPGHRTGEVEERVTAGAQGLSHERIADHEVADRIRYRYPTATSEKTQNGEFSEEKPP